MRVRLQSFLDYLKNLTADVQIVQGDFDEFTSPEEKVGRARTHCVIMCCVELSLEMPYCDTALAPARPSHLSACVAPVLRTCAHGALRTARRSRSSKQASDTPPRQSVTAAHAPHLTRAAPVNPKPLTRAARAPESLRLPLLPGGHTRHGCNTRHTLTEKPNLNP
jgi:hypothetical protein